MRPISILALCLALVVQEFHALAQVPHVMTYQGRVASGGTNFSGTGQFKFALVSGGTSAAAQASGVATVSFGFVVQIAITSGGAGYMAAPAVTITDSAGSGAFAIAQIANGQVTGITVTDAGSGYSASPTITIAPPAANVSYTTYWSHDGTSSAGGEPASVVPVSVSQGLFTVGLGDTMIPNMSALPPQVLANSDVRLRMWFNDGVNGFSQLSPDQRLTAAAYAMMAETMRDGAVTAAKLAPGAVGASQLADGAITAAKLATNANMATPSGSIVLSQEANAINLLAAGYVKMPGVNVVTDDWEIVPAKNSPGGRQRASLLSARSEMILWGGDDAPTGVALNTGSRFSTASNSWSAISTNNAPSARRSHSAVWTGDKMIVWGGFTRFQYSSNVNSGGIYSPPDDSWSVVTTDSAPAPRSGHLALWTGSEMVIWGGAQEAYASVPYTSLNTGSRYDPLLNRWSEMSSVGAPSPRENAFAAWTGSEVIIWGGTSGRPYDGVSTPGIFYNTGARYNATANTWSPMSEPTNSAGDKLFFATYESSTAVWTGTELVVWNSAGGLRGGARYNPATDAWRAMNSSGPRGGQYSATFTGHSIFYFSNSGQPCAIYDLATDGWTFVSFPSGLFTTYGTYFTASVADSFLVFDFSRPWCFTKYTPRRPLFLYQRP